MRNCLLRFPLLLLSLLFAVTGYSQLQKIFLHPKGTGSERQSQFVDSIAFVPLDIKGDIETGRYNNVVVTDNYFLITEYANSELSFFGRDGRFIKKVNFKKLGQNFYPIYHASANRLVFFGSNKNYSLTSKDRIQIQLDWSNPRNKKYFKKYFIDLADSSLRIQNDEPTQGDVAGATPLYGDYVWNGRIATSNLYKDSLDYEARIYKGNQLVKGFFPYNRINETRYLYTSEITVANPTNNPFTYMLTRPFCDTIYRLNHDSVFAAYQLVLPLENTLPASFFSKPFANKTERENFSRNNGWLLHQIYQFYETSRFILLTVAYLSNYESYVYLKQSNNSYNVKKIKADSTQYNLTLLDDYNIGKQGDRLYTTVRAGELLSFFQQNKTVAVPKELANYLKSAPPENAPVVVTYKLKN